MSAYAYDVVVIGAGIHGAGVSQAAAVRGYKVLLLEQNDIAAGTSSRSSKLIHGGLRYLETGQFRLVRECLQERRTLLRIAPHLVRLVPFYIPIYQHTRRRPWQIRIGLSVYAMLTGWARSATFKSLARAHWHRLTGLDQQGLQAVFQYWDAQTDDAALTRAVVASALEHGAQLVRPAQFIAAHPHAEGVRVVYKTAQGQQEIYTRTLVNAAGPWVGAVAQACMLAMPMPAIELVEGAHIVVDAPAPPGIYYLEAPQDGRAIFVMPWRGQTLVGTTERIYTGEPGAAAPRVTDCEYLLTAMAHYFSFAKALTAQDVIASFAGLRVLPSGAGSAFQRPRETLLPVDRTQRPRCLAIYGGKLTAYRATAEKVMHKLASSLPPPRRQADTRYVMLPSGEGLR
ncbi:MAG: glycerol-3-phosphate dehydrogenase/oxidase [Pseudomonadota bacterium]